MRPYFIPERSRTKSENAEPTHTNIHQNIKSENIFATICFRGEGTNSINVNSTMMDTSCDSTGVHEINNSAISILSNKPVKKNYQHGIIKKFKSLEDINRVTRIVDGSQPSHEMEFVSSRIQKLKVQDE